MSFATMRAICHYCHYAKQVVEYQTGRICRNCVPQLVDNLERDIKIYKSRMDLAIDDLNHLKERYEGLK